MKEEQPFCAGSGEEEEGGGTPRVGGASAGEYLIGLVGAEIRIACYEIRSDI